MVAMVHRFVPESTWLMLHLVFLGALTHSILVWSRYFAEALLKTPHTEVARRGESLRIGLLICGTCCVLIGVPSGLGLLVVAGATLVATTVLLHGVSLWRMLRGGLPGRFRGTLHYYLAAAASLVVGATFGGILGSVPGGMAEPWHGRLLFAHTMCNLLGWMGLTLTGTLVTFWPTMLRTRMDPRADSLAAEALPALLAGLLIAVGGALAGVMPAALVGVVLYAVGLVWWGRGLVMPLRVKPPREFAPASVLAGLVWAGVGLVWVIVLLTRAGAGADAWARFVAGMTPVAGVFAGGVAVQVVIGALGYLLPTVLGGGPAVVRATVAELDRHAAARLVLLNGGLVGLLAPLPSWVRVAMSLLGLVGAVWFLPLAFRAVRVNLRAKRAVTAGEAVVGGEPRQAGSRFWSVRQLAAAASALVVAAALGVGVDPAAAGFGARPNAGGAATGRTVRVEVSARSMRFEPSSVNVAAGDRLVIDLVNEDPVMAHDLVLAGADSGRLAPGERAEVDAGVIGESTQGWCSIAGHKQAGMVLDVVVTGGSAQAAVSDATAGEHSGHGSMAGAASPASRVMAAPDARLSTFVDAALPELPPAGAGPTTHRVELTATEVPLEVAPGVWQKRWTFNGTPVGPTLHGRVGDVFEVTLRNDGSMGHSVDFHAGALAPDGPMRTIKPGESLVYRFTATRAGAWMYHCSTHPMSSHIAAGMAGAVVIEPKGLPRVDRSYVLTQSEAYVAAGADGKAAADAASAVDLDADKLAARRPDFVTFNGVANQYDQRPLQARVGEQVRIWAVDLGPNVASSLHVVGGQFDTTFSEGAYLLKQGRDAFGGTHGGSQALALQPAQGGFVELVFPEPGHYPLVSHLMSDAESGAHGVVHVTR